MEDEGLILSNQHLAPDAVIAWRAMGVDVVRIHARWWEIAPTRRPPRTVGLQRRRTTTIRATAGPTSTTRPAWSATTGMRVMLTITGPGPLWTSSQPSKRNPRWMPSTKAYARVLARVATRYRDQVDRYLIWNEPNQQGWLQPQWDCDSRRRNCKPVSPHVYRGLVRAAVPQIRAADRGAEIVAGELAPIGNDADLATTRR